MRDEQPVTEPAASPVGPLHSGRPPPLREFDEYAAHPVGTVLTMVGRSTGRLALGRGRERLPSPV
ncbi:hypothetical protein [Bailinhaonella thermotolerans]|uniref:hypothetical protein n=1 Tax=Bailinhaonella thermotolerans TaxID=1070861 RepID=UPI0011C3ADEF|nr:hypothetical protein [Bailinhaonella thermotolerans]